MNIEDLLKVLSLLDQKSKNNETSIFDEFIGKYVIARTYSAGVTIGFLKNHSNTEAVLTDARKICCWKNRFTLYEISLKGVAEGSKLSEIIPIVGLTQVIEILPCSTKAEEQLKNYEAYQI